MDIEFCEVFKIILFIILLWENSIGVFWSFPYAIFLLIVWKNILIFKLILQDAASELSL